MRNIPSIFFLFLKHTVKFLIRRNDQSVFLMICNHEKSLLFQYCVEHTKVGSNFIFKSQCRLAETLISLLIVSSNVQHLF